MQQEAVAIIFISWIRWNCISKLGDLSHKDLIAHTLIVHTILQLSLLLLSYTAPYLKDSIVTSKWCNFFYQLDWFSIAVFFWKVWFLSWFSIAFVLKVWLWCSFLFLWVQDILWRTQFSRAVRGLISGWTEKRWHDANIAEHDSCKCRATISAMVGISGVWWCNGGSETHGFIDYAHPHCLQPLQKQIQATGCSLPGCFFS